MVNVPYGYAGDGPAYVFVSYSHRDDAQGALTRFIEKVFDACAAAHPDCRLKPFIDQSGILPGDQWRKVITDSLDKAMLFLPCVTPNYCLSDECAFEFDYFDRLMRESPRTRRCIPLFWEEIDPKFTEISSFNKDLLQRLRAINGADTLALLSMRTSRREKLEQIVVEDLSDRLYSAWCAIQAGESDVSDKPIVDSARTGDVTGVESRSSKEERAGELVEKADTLQQAGKPQEGEPVAREAYALFKALYGTGDEGTLHCLLIYVKILCDLGRYDDALPLCRTWVAERLRTDDKADVEYAVSWLTYVLGRQGDGFREQGRFTEAEEVSREAFELRRKWYGLSDKRTLSSLHRVIYALVGANKYVDALPLCWTLVEEREKLYPADSPEVVDARKWLTSTLCQRSYQLMQRKQRLGESERLSREAFALRKKWYGLSDKSTLSALHMVIYALSDQHKYVDALPLCQTLVEEREKLYPADSPEVDDARKWLEFLERKSA